MSDQLPDVLFVDDLAKSLRCSRRTIERRLRAGADLPPEMRRIDSTHRWLRETVEAWKRAPSEPTLRQTVDVRFFKGARGRR